LLQRTLWEVETDPIPEERDLYQGAIGQRNRESPPSSVITNSIAYKS